MNPDTKSAYLLSQRDLPRHLNYTRIGKYHRDARPRVHYKKARHMARLFSWTPDTGSLTLLRRVDVGTGPLRHFSSEVEGL